MEILNSINSLSESSTGGVFTIGNFDGVHLGHRELIGEVCRRARALNRAAVVMTFDPHPASVLRPDHPVVPLFGRDDLIEQIKKLGVDCLVIENFTVQMAELGPYDFLQNYVWGPGKPREIVVGYDFSFGRQRQGNFSFLSEWSHSHEILATQIPPHTVNGEIVSSSMIRRFLQQGKVVSAAQFLGRPFYFRGEVKKGDGRGARIGFPTMNVHGSNLGNLKKGVYVTRVWIGDKPYPAVSNWGTRPTFSPQSEMILETHVLDQAGHFYGEIVRVEFLDHIRDELKFGSADELIKQIQSDVSVARSFFQM